MMVFETSKHVPKTEKRCCVFKDEDILCQSCLLLSINYVEMERPQNTVETMENNESN